MKSSTQFMDTSPGKIFLVVVVVVALIWPLNLVYQSKQVNAFLLATTSVCFNSLSSSFQSECVYCKKAQYLQTLQLCLGQPSLPQNITQEQAFCIATTCLHQTWRNPIVLGRRKRSIQLNMPLLGSLNKTSLTNGSLVLTNPLTTVQNLLGLNRISQNPFTLAWNYSNRSLSWRIGREPGTSVAVTTAAASSATMPKAAASAPAPAKPAAPASAPPAPAAPPKPAQTAPAAGPPPPAAGPPKPGAPPAGKP